MGKLNADQISAAIDGEADENVMVIIAKDPASAEQVKQARKFETALRHKLHRWDCPNSIALGNFHHGLLSTSESETIQQHVNNCVRCQEDLAKLEAFLAHDHDAEANFVDESTQSVDMSSHRSEEIIIQVHTTSNLASIDMRGEDDAQHSIHIHTDGLTVFLEANQDKDQWEMTGGIVADDVQEQLELQHIIFEFWQDNTLIAAVFADEDGNFETKIALEPEQPLILRAIIRPDYVIKLNDIVLSKPDN